MTYAIIILSCLIESPRECRTVLLPAGTFETKRECRYQGIPIVNRYGKQTPGRFIRRWDCVPHQGSEGVEHDA